MIKINHLPISIINHWIYALLVFFPVLVDGKTTFYPDFYVCTLHRFFSSVKPGNTSDVEGDVIIIPLDLVCCGRCHVIVNPSPACLLSWFILCRAVNGWSIRGCEVWCDDASKQRNPGLVFLQTVSQLNSSSRARDCHNSIDCPGVLNIQEDKILATWRLKYTLTQAGEGW